MGASMKKCCCCCCKDKKEEEKPLLDEELAVGGVVENQQQADKLIARSLAKYRHDKERPSPDVDPALTPVEQAVARYNVRSERQEL